MTYENVNIAALKQRLNRVSAQQRMRRKMGNGIVDGIINLIHDEKKELTFSERDDLVEKICQTVLVLQEVVDTYFEHKEKESSIILPSFESAREQICKVGRDMEEGNCDMFELLTCDIPLFRTIATIYTKEKKDDSKV